MIERYNKLELLVLQSSLSWSESYWRSAKKRYIFKQARIASVLKWAKFVEFAFVKL